MKKIIYSRDINIPDEDFVNKILEIDASVYPLDMQGTMNSVLSRYHANKDEYILLTDDTGEIIGYLCCFPVKESFYNELIESSHAFDDDITPDKIVPYIRGTPHRLFMISIAVKPDSRDGAAKLLSAAFEDFLEDKQRNDFPILSVAACAMTYKGAGFLVKSGFSCIKNLEGSYQIYVRDFNYKDVYVFFPMLKSAEIIPSPKINCELQSFIDTINDTLKYECRSDVHTILEHHPIGTHRIGIRPDTYEDNDIITFIEADIVLVAHKHSPLVLTILVFKYASFDVTRLMDNISTGRLSIETEGTSELFLKYFENKHNCKIAGVGRALICTAKELGEEILSIFAGETYKSSTLAGSTIKDTGGNHTPYKLRHEVFELERTENIALYNWYKCYTSKRAVIYVLPSMSERSSFKDTFQYEAAIVFIMELLMFRSNAIESANKQVLECLSMMQSLTLKNIEDLYNFVGRTLILWEKENYNYAVVQKLYDNIARHFELDAEEKNFYRKLEQIEHTIELRRSQKNEKDSKDVNKTLMVLAVMQVVLVVSQVILGLIEILDLPIWVWVSLLVLCGLAMGVILIFFIQGRRKRNV